VFGLMRDATIDEVRGYIDQLVANDFLRQTDDQYPVLHLTPEGVALMKDAHAVPDLTLARQKKPEKGKPPKRSGAEAASWEGVDRELFDALRALGSTLPANGACRRTSSSTTRRCATWRV
jgi:ATP-dependent DNA helicase RecQ